MKLWLQVLFAQGYLWRDRFPDQFAAMSESEARPTWGTFVPLAIVILGVVLAAGGRAWGVPFATAGIGWFLYAAHALRPDRLIGSTERWLSIAWAGGLITLVSDLTLAGFALASGRWNPLVLAGLLWICPITSWLRFMQANYLIFSDPERNRWRLDPQQNPRKEGWVAQWRDLLMPTYWHLPRQLIFGVEPPRPEGGA